MLASFSSEGAPPPSSRPLKKMKSKSIRWKEIKKLVRKQHTIRDKKGPAMAQEKLDQQRRRIDKMSESKRARKHAAGARKERKG